ncbi:MFS transporter [Streptomyces sp. AP-93]|uniref:MFS transporter n=1 Tax=Streptomyces sp. AP-93 TaxID=2929048 RepID=UPI001FAEFD3F|nr:MFS transporter [Streptomyces sp. AP-93]MCJ0869974.1 MFS transporter [Streptomyces sp. AP-93]
MPEAVPRPACGAPAGPPDPRRWWALAVIGLAQLMVVLDATIVNIALPSAQRDLGMSDGNRQWVITAYALAFGGLLLLGGRIADLIGRRRAFVIGLSGFAFASALGGAAGGPGMLFAARALQGVFAALLAPCALSLLATTFDTPTERAKAFGVFAAIASGGGAVGLIAGGLLTEYLNWRWCLYVNVAIAAIAVLGTFAVLRDSERTGAKLDVPGAVLGCGGLLAIVYGLSEAEPRGWSDGLVAGLLIGGSALLAAFAWWQARASDPMLPPHVIRDRTRAGCLVTMTLATITLLPVLLFMSYYFQLVLGYSPVKTGLAFLPMTLAIITGATQVSARFLDRLAPRSLIVPGLLLATVALVLLTRLTVDSSYTSQVLPAMLVLGFGMGLVFMPVMSTATQGVARSDSGVTSATLNTAQQVGGAIGTALLNTIASTAATAYAAAHLAGPAESAHRAPASPAQQLIEAQGVVHGFGVALWWAAGIMLLGAAVAAVTVTAPAPAPRREMLGAAVAAPTP